MTRRELKILLTWPGRQVPQTTMVSVPQTVKRIDSRSSLVVPIHAGKSLSGSGPARTSSPTAILIDAAAITFACQTMVHGAHSRAGPLFEPVDAAFSDIALPVDVAVERWRTHLGYRSAAGGCAGRGIRVDRSAIHRAPHGRCGSSPACQRGSCSEVAHGAFLSALAVRRSRAFVGPGPRPGPGR